jgi:hypothetical protein
VPNVSDVLAILLLEAVQLGATHDPRVLPVGGGDRVRDDDLGRVVHVVGRRDIARRPRPEGGELLVGAPPEQHRVGGGPAIAVRLAADGAQLALIDLKGQSETAGLVRQQRVGAVVETWTCDDARLITGRTMIVDGGGCMHSGWRSAAAGATPKTCSMQVTLLSSIRLHIASEDPMAPALPTATQLAATSGAATLHPVGCVPAPPGSRSGRGGARTMPRDACDTTRAPASRVPVTTRRHH